MISVQETPQIFMLALVLGVLASLVTVVLAGWRFVRGRRANAIRLLSRWGVYALIYLAISVAVSLARPASVIEQGQNWCFDDWCLAVEAVHRVPSQNARDATVRADIRIYNAGRSPEGAQDSHAPRSTLSFRGTRG
jgi:hypothetical protein